MDLIAEEIAYYKAHRVEFIKQYGDKHLIIKGKEVVGVFASNSEAVDAACLLEEGTFIIEHPVDLS